MYLTYLKKMTINKKSKSYILLRKIFYFFKNLITRNTNLNKFSPISKTFGLERGEAIDRYYILKFLKNNSNFISGTVLEFGDDRYSTYFNCKKIDVISIDKSTSKLVKKNTRVFIKDITKEKLGPNYYDTIIATQVIQFIYDIEQLKKNLHFSIKKDGYLILTCSFFSPLSNYDIERWGEFWRPTENSIKRIFDENFTMINSQCFGNLFAVKKFLDGISADELKKKDLDHLDKSFPIIHAFIFKKK